MKTNAFNVEQFLWDEAERESQSWFKLQSQNVFADLYLYFKRGELKVSANRPEGFSLADGRRLGPSGNAEQIKARIYETARRLPCLPEA